MVVTSKNNDTLTGFSNSCVTLQSNTRLVNCGKWFRENTEQTE